MIYVIGDTHFNHHNILSYERTNFSSIEEMNNTIINNWNAIVKDNDTVYVLGDFIMGDPSKIKDILFALKGKIILIRGNHDTPRKIMEYKKYPEKIIVKDLDFFSHKGLTFIFCHFPIINEDFIKMLIGNNKEIIYVHAHYHNNIFNEKYDNIYNVTASNINYTPMLLYN